MLQKASEEDRLVTAALNTHGTRAVQKLIETLATREQVCSILCKASLRITPSLHNHVVHNKHVDDTTGLNSSCRCSACSTALHC